MRLLDGLRGIDFSGIGDDNPDDNSDSPSSYIKNQIAVGNSSGAQDIVNAQNIIAASTPNAAQIFDAFTGSAPAKPVTGEMIGSPSLWSEMLGAPNSVAQSITSTINSLINPPASGADVSEEIPHDARQNPSGYNTGTGKFNYYGSDVYKQSQSPSLSVNSILSAATNFVNSGASQAVMDFDSIGDSGVKAASDVGSQISSAIFGTPVKSSAPQSASSAARPQAGSPAQTRSGSSSGGSGSSTFTQDFNTVTNGILNVVGSIFAMKQQGQQQRQAAGAANPAASQPGARGVKGKPGSSGGSSLNTYLLIGGGILAVGALVFLVSKD